MIDLPLPENELRLLSALLDKREEVAYREVSTKFDRLLCDLDGRGGLGSTLSNDLRRTIALRRLYVLEQVDVIDLVSQTLAKGHREWTDGLASAVYQYAESQVKGILDTFLNEYEGQFRRMGRTPHEPAKAYSMATQETIKFLSKIRRDLDIRVSAARIANTTNVRLEVNRPSGLTVFVSYAHENGKELKKLQDHLAILKHEGLISLWYDRAISAGKELDTEIDEHLDSADIILLLVSDAFLASDYCYGIEVSRAMERHETGDARVIPIIIRHCAWKEALFRGLKALPKDGRPVYGGGWKNADQAFADVSHEIGKVVEDMRQHRADRQCLAPVSDGANKQGIKISFGMVASVRFGDQRYWPAPLHHPAVFVENHGSKTFTIRRVTLYCTTSSETAGPTKHRLSLTLDKQCSVITPCKPINREDIDEWRKAYCFVFEGRQRALQAAEEMSLAPPDTLGLEIWADEDEESPIVLMTGHELTNLQSLITRHLGQMRHLVSPE